MPATAEEISAAQSVILHDVYAPALFNKLAQFGIVPQTEDEAVSLVKMARAGQSLRRSDHRLGQRPGQASVH